MLATRRQLLAAALVPRTARRQRTFGHSVDGVPLVVTVVGDAATATTRVLVVGCTHGNESAGLAIVDRLLTRRPPAGTAWWLVRTVNPDGVRLGQRQNARGVDLNRNFPRWRPGPRGLFYPGPRPQSEPETQATVRLLQTVRPDASIWFHQHASCVDVTGPHGRGIARAYAQQVRLPTRRLTPYWGSASSWQQSIRTTAAFVVELGPSLSSAEAERHAAAFRSITRPPSR